MAYAGGIGQEIDQLKDLSVEELVRRQNLDPSLIYTIALQEKEKMNAAGARQGVLDEPKPEGTVTSQMEQNLAQQTMPQSPVNRLAPGIQQQGQRSMQQPQPQPQQRPQMAQGISGAPANNMGAVGRARGGIIEYANGGMPQAQTPTTGAQQAAPVTPVTPEQVAAFRARLRELNEAKAKAFPQEKAMFQQQIQDLLATTPAAIRNAAGGAGMAFGGVVGERDRAIDMDALLDALMMAESGGDPNAVSRAGAEGLYQIMPSTGRQPGFGVEPLGDAFDPQESRRFARDYLQAMLDRYDGDVEAALIAYNAGFGNADKFIAADRNLSALPRRGETEPYVRKIMGQLEKEDRRRDLQMGGGRTISTTAPESYTEKRRRERLGRQEAGLASLYPEVAMEEAEMYEPNLPDALTVMQAMESLRDGKEETPVIAGFPTREETDKAFTDAGLSGYGDGSRIRQRGRTGPEEEKLSQFDERSPQIASFPEPPNAGIAGYLKNIGRQQQQRRDDFREAVPGAEAAVARAKQEKEDGGIGYLRRLGRLQEGAAQRQAEEEERAAKFMAMLIANQNKSEVEPVRPFVNESFKNGGGVKRFAGEDGSFIDTLGDMQRSAYEATKDYMPDFGNIVEGQMENAAEDPLNYTANAILALYGGPAIVRGGAKLLGPLFAKHGPKVMQRVKDLALRATTKPNPALTKGPGFTMRSPGTRGRVVDPLKVGVGTGLAIKAGDALLGGEDEEEKLSQFDERSPQIASFPEPPNAGIAGALDKAKPLGSLALKLAKVLGRGGGASEGFEFAKINEESSRLRSEEAKMQLARDQIAATTGQSAARSAATANTALVKLITEYQNGSAYQIDLAAKANELGLEKDDASVIKAVMDAYIDNLQNVQSILGGGMSSMQGLGGGGLSAADQALIDQYAPSN